MTSPQPTARPLQREKRTCPTCGTKSAVTAADERAIADMAAYFAARHSPCKYPIQESTP